MKTHAALQMYFDRKKKTSSGFSLRSLARRLDVSPSFLSRVMSGKKPIPANLQDRLAKALDVEPELLGSAATPSPAEPAQAVEDWRVTTSDTLQVLRNWYYLPILEVTTLSNYDGSAAQITERLGLAPETTEVALRELVSLGLLKIVDGRYQKSEDKIRFTSAKTISFIRKYHDDMLEKCQQALRTATTEEEFQRRLIIGITITADPEKIAEAKRRLADCLYEIANDLIAAPGTEVYQLSAQLLPLTKLTKA